MALSAGAFSGAVVLAPPASAAPVRGLAWLLFLGSSVHVAATGWLYTLPDVRAHVAARPVRYAWIPAGLVVAGAVTAAVLSPAAMAWLLLAYFGWQFFHFQKQNLGLAALAASIHRVRPLGRAERRALMGAGGAGILGLLAHPGLLQLRVSPAAGSMFTVAGLLFAAAAGSGVVALVRRPAADRPAGFCAMYLMALLFSLPIFAFRSPYAAVGGMTIAHGFQYLLLVGLVAAGNRGDIPLAPTGRVRQRRPGGRSAAQRRVASARVPARDPPGLRCLPGGGDGALRDRRRILADA